MAPRRTIPRFLFACSSIVFLVTLGACGDESGGRMAYSERREAAGGERLMRATALDSRVSAGILAEIGATNVLAAPMDADAERQLIRNADIRVEVGDVRGSLEQLERLAEASGGYISNQSVNESSYGDDNVRLHGNVTVRIPAALLDSALAEIAAMGEVKSERVWTQDVTEEYYDTAIRLRNAREEREQLSDVLERARSVEDVLAVRRELNRVTTELERLTGRMRRLQNQIELSTVNVELIEEMPPLKDPDSGIGKVVGAFGTMVDVFWGTLAGIIVAVGALVPLGVVGWVVTIAVIRIVRRRRTRVPRKKRKSREVSEEENRISE